MQNNKTKSNDFGSKCELSDTFIKKILKTGIAEQVLLYAKLKEESMMTQAMRRPGELEMQNEKSM